MTSQTPSRPFASELRLDATQRHALLWAIQDVDGEVYLFGSRVNRHARGGDVDILIMSGADPYLLSKNVTRRFFSLCEEKIDVVVLNPSALTPEQEAFLRVIEMVRIQ